MAHFAGNVKIDWSINTRDLLVEAQHIAESVQNELLTVGIQDEMPLQIVFDQESLRSLPIEQADLLLINSISPLPLHKALVLRDTIYKEASSKLKNHFLLALAKTLVNSASNLQFGPEVGLGVIKNDAAVISPWITHVQAMVQDINTFANEHQAQATIYLGDARVVETILPEQSIDIVITSPHILMKKTIHERHV